MFSHKGRGDKKDHIHYPLGKWHKWSLKFTTYYNLVPQNFNFGNVTSKLIILLQFNSYYKKNVKFLAPEEHHTKFERVIDG